MPSSNVAATRAPLVDALQKMKHTAKLRDSVIEILEADHSKNPVPVGIRCSILPVARYNYQSNARSFVKVRRSGERFQPIPIAFTPSTPIYVQVDRLAKRQFGDYLTAELRYIGVVDLTERAGEPEIVFGAISALGPDRKRNGSLESDESWQHASSFMLADPIYQPTFRRLREIVTGINGSPRRSLQLAELKPS